MSGGESPQGYVVSESEEGVARGYDFGRECTFDLR